MSHIVTIDETVADDVFGGLSTGDYFWFKGNYFQKVGGDSYSSLAVRFSNGVVNTFANDTPVRKIPRGSVIEIQVKQ